MTFDDRKYFRQRAEEERARAESAASPAIAELHLTLATKYESLAEKSGANSMVHTELDDGERERA